MSDQSTVFQPRNGSIGMLKQKLKLLKRKSFQPRNGSIGIRKNLKGRESGRFNPATVRLELTTDERMNALVLVSTPQRFDWNR